MKLYFKIGRLGDSYGATDSLEDAEKFMDVKPGRHVEVVDLPSVPLEYVPVHKPPKPVQQITEAPSNDEPDEGEGLEEEEGKE